MNYVESEHHAKLMKKISDEFKPILEESNQGVYVYLDDNHFIFNRNMAVILGYESSAQMESIKTPFLESFVEKRSQSNLAIAFGKAIEKKAGSAETIYWKKRDGGTLETITIIVPVVFQGHIFALHFVE